MIKDLNILEIPNSPIEVDIDDEDILSIRDAENFYKKSQILGLHDGKKCLECGFEFKEHKHTGTYYTSATTHIFLKHLMPDDQREDWIKRTSEIMIERWKDPEYKKKTSGKIKEVLNQPEHVQRSRDQMLELWKDPEFQKLVSDTSTKMWENPEYKEYMSQLSKERWEDPEYKKKKSDEMLKRWEDPEYRKKTLDALDAVRQDEEHIKLMSKLTTERWQDPEYRENITGKLIKYWSQDSVRKARSEEMKERYKDPEYNEKMKKIQTDPEYRKMMSEIRLGVPISGKEVIQYDLQGNVIAEFEKLKDATAAIKFSKNSGSIGQCCLRKKDTVGGYIWRYKKDPLTPDDYSTIRIEKLHSGKPVIQYDLQGNFIAEYERLKDGTEAIKFPKTSTNIGQCCLRKRRTAGGYIWRYKDDPLTQNDYSKLRIGKPKPGKPVIQYDMQGNIITEYESIKDAKKMVGNGNIGLCCNRHRKTSCGYIWRFKKDPLTEDEKKCLMET